LRSSIAYLRGDIGRSFEMARAAQDDAAATARALSDMLVGMALYFRGVGAEASRTS
jgi:hypothetical protein